MGRLEEDGLRMENGLYYSRSCWPDDVRGDDFKDRGIVEKGGRPGEEGREMHSLNEFCLYFFFLNFCCTAFDFLTASFTHAEGFEHVLDCKKLQPLHPY